MILPTTRLLTLCLLAVVSARSAAEAQVTLTSDEVLRVRFAVPQPLSLPPDVLSLGLGLVTVNQAITRRSATIFNCDDRLGEHSDTQFGTTTGRLSLGVANTFRTASSPYRFINPAVIDMTSIANGTIEGLLHFRIDTGSITLPSLDQVNLRLLRATGTSSGTPVNPAVVILSREIVPELSLSSVALNANSTLSVTGTAPGSTTFFTFGTLCGTLPLPCPGLPMLDTLNPVVFVPMPPSASGVPSLTLFVPSTTAGLSFLFQAIELDSCLRTSNLLPVTF